MSKCMLKIIFHLKLKYSPYFSNMNTYFYACIWLDAVLFVLILCWSNIFDGIKQFSKIIRRFSLSNKTGLLLIQVLSYTRRTGNFWKAQCFRKLTKLIQVIQSDNFNEIFFDLAFLKHSYSKHFYSKSFLFKAVHFRIPTFLHNYRKSLSIRPGSCNFSFVY